MGKLTGFMEYDRVAYPTRPVSDRVHDYKEIYLEFPADILREQGARCMDCGVPFCHQGCPLGNLIPDWNDLVYRNRWKDAIERLHATNNFPEFTGLLCPAPCEGACVLGINEKPVTIKYIELNIIEHAFREGWVKPVPAQLKTGKKIAVVGSGPAGLACAQQLARAGHEVTVFEKADRIGGLLRYGIPDFKMEKQRIDFRIEQMRAEGVTFKTSCEVGAKNQPNQRHGRAEGEAPAALPMEGATRAPLDVQSLKKDFDATALCLGAMQPRELDAPGRDLKGVHLAMEYLTQQNQVDAGDKIDNQITAKGKHVIILGGGDTGADCLGTAHRQGARSVTQIELMPRPPDTRAPNNPWPQWPQVFRTASAHEEGGKRNYAILTRKILGENGAVKQLQAVKLEWYSENGATKFREIAGSEFEIPADLVLLAMGFVSPVKAGLIENLGVKLDSRGNVTVDDNKMTSETGIFAAGDVHRGASLIVWAIAEGRECAKGIDAFLMGSSELP